MNAADINTPAGTPVTVTLTDGTTISGDFISVNSKGINVKVDGKVISRGLTRVVSVIPATDTTPDVPADLFADSDTYTASTLAAILDMTSKELRVVLRSLGMNVGKGQRYSWDANTARTVAGQVQAARVTTTN